MSAESPQLPRAVRMISNRWLVAGGLLLFVLMLVASFLDYRTTQQQYEDARWVAHTREAIEALTMLESDLSEARAALRGHMLLRAPGEVGTFISRADDANRQLQAIELLTKDNPVQQAALTPLRARLADLQRIWARGLQAFERNGQPAANAVFADSDGAALVQSIYDDIHRMIVHERTLLAQRAAASERAYLIALWTAVGSGAMSIVLVALYVWVLQRHARASAESAQRLLALSEALRRADERKDAFIAMLAHELRNPLAPIRTASEVLARSGSDPAVVGRMAAMLGRQTSHMAVLLNDLLDVSRITRGKLEIRRAPVRINAVVEEALEASLPGINAKEMKLEVEHAAPEVLAEVDAVRLSQVITNLLNNAARYTPAGGAIRLAVEAGDADLRITVRDTGIGISEEAQARVFDMFEQEAPWSVQTQGGLGLGLPLAKGIVELHGGSIAVFSEGRGKGSEFVVNLPGVVRRGPAPPGAHDSGSTLSV